MAGDETEGKDIWGNPIGKDVWGNLKDTNVYGEAPKDIQGNKGKDIWGNEIEE